MILPLQINFRNMPASEAMESHIKQKSAKLEKFYKNIISCRVVVDSPQRRRHQGNLYDVRIDVSIPGKEIVVTREDNQDAYVALRDAFAAATRKLEEQRRRERGVVKTHEEVPTGRVIRLFPDAKYGFLRSNDERDIYFHGNSVVNGDFTRLKIGTEVSYLEEQGQEGPQAMRVVVRKAA